MWRYTLFFKSKTFLSLGQDGGHDVQRRVYLLLRDAQRRRESDDVAFIKNKRWSGGVA